MTTTIDKNQTRKHPNSSTPQMKIFGSAVGYVKKIAKQIVRFNKMETSEFVKYLAAHRFASFHTFTDVDGLGVYNYGEIGDECFDCLCELVIKLEPGLKGKCELSLIKNELKAAYLSKFIKAKGAMSKLEVEAYMLGVVEKIKGLSDVYEFFLPCVFFIIDSPDSFDVGPARFMKTSEFLRISESLVLAGVDSKSLRYKVIEYYKESPWVVSIKVEGFDSASTYEWAVFYCSTALNVLRVLFGAYETRWVRLSNDLGGPLKTSMIWSTGAKGVECSSSFRAAFPSGPLNWYEYLHEDGALQIRRTLGSVIDHTCKFGAYSEMSNRLLDAVNWFGDAATERSPSASILKYVTAIERLYFGAFYKGFKKKFVSRILKVFTDFDVHCTDTVAEDLDAIYDMRSTLSHGAVSPKFSDSVWPASKAEEISRQCIFCALQLYAMFNEAYKPETPSELEDCFLVYETEGIEYVIGKAEEKRLANAT